MAARENQGLQIWLIIFAALWVISTGLTYWFYSKWQGEFARAESAQTSQQEASNKAVQAENQSARFKEMLGFGPNEDLDKIETEFSKDRDSYAKGYPEDQQKNYRSLMKAMHANIQAAESRAADSKLSATKDKTNFDAVEDRSKKEKQELDTQLQLAQGTLGKERDDWKQSLLKEKKTAEEQATKSAQFQQEVGSLKVEMKTKEQLAEKELQKKQDTIEYQKDTIVQITDQNFEDPDGRVISVDQRTGVVIINLGSEDDLPSKISFKVYSVDETDAHKAVSKGSIEVTRILDSHMAEARITEDDRLDPIFPQDMIYSPIWSRGRREHVALAGLIDIDGDGLPDSEKLKRIIELNGGVVDAETLEDGTVKGAMNLNTRFLIIGQQAEVAGKADAPGDAGKSKEAKGFGDMQSEARSLSVTIITVDKFLDHLGWKEENRTIPLDQQATGEQFVPRPPVQPLEGTRRPGPPQFKRRLPRAY